VIIMAEQTPLKTPVGKAFCVLLILSLMLPLSGCPASTGEKPDMLGSYSQINQLIVRGEDWQQIVQNSRFQLGEKWEAGYWYEGNKQIDYYMMSYGTYPSIDGSTVAVPMAVEFARQHLGFYDQDACDFTVFSTTHIAYLNLIKREGVGTRMLRSGDPVFMDDTHPVDLLIVTEPSEEELSLAEQAGVSLVVRPICYDAFVFITHVDNPVDSLTLDQVRGIYSGRFTNWSQVGGEDMPIVAFQREENSGSQTGMINLVMGDTPMLPPETVEVVWGMGQLIETVAEYRNDSASIGYTYKYYIDNLYRNDSIKILNIEGVAPDGANLRSGSYPLAACYYSVIRAGEETAPAGLFTDWMLSREGQKCIEQAGYVPYTAY